MQHHKPVVANMMQKVVVEQVLWSFGVDHTGWHRGPVAECGPWTSLAQHLRGVLKQAWQKSCFSAKLGDLKENLASAERGLIAIHQMFEGLFEV